MSGDSPWDWKAVVHRNSRRTRLHLVNSENARGSVRWRWLVLLLLLMYSGAPNREGGGVGGSQHSNRFLKCESFLIA